MTEHEPQAVDVTYLEINSGPQDPVEAAARLTRVQLEVWRSRFTETPEEPGLVEATYPFENGTEVVVSSADAYSVLIEKSFNGITTRYHFDGTQDEPLHAEQQIADNNPTSIHANPTALFTDALRMLYDVNRFEQQGRT